MRVMGRRCLVRNVTGKLDSVYHTQFLTIFRQTARIFELKRLLEEGADWCVFGVAQRLSKNALSGSFCSWVFVYPGGVANGIVDCRGVLGSDQYIERYVHRNLYFNKFANDVSSSCKFLFSFPSIPTHCFTKAQVVIPCDPSPAFSQVPAWMISRWGDFSKLEIQSDLC